MERTVILLKEDGTIYDSCNVEFYKYRSFKNKYDTYFREGGVDEDVIISEILITDESCHLRTKIKPLRVTFAISPMFRRGQISYETN